LDKIEDSGVLWDGGQVGGANQNFSCAARDEVVLQRRQALGRSRDQQQFTSSSRKLALHFERDARGSSQDHDFLHGRYAWSREAYRHCHSTSVTRRQNDDDIFGSM
jgi:hypothetical protein